MRDRDERTLAARRALRSEVRSQASFAETLKPFLKVTVDALVAIGVVGIIIILLIVVLGVGGAFARSAGCTSTSALSPMSVRGTAARVAQFEERVACAS